MTIRGLGKTIYSIELRHLCVLAALASMKLPQHINDTDVTQIAQTALNLGLELYNQIDMNDSMDEFQTLDPEDFKGEDETT